MPKKTLRFATEENHDDFEQINIAPTTALNLDDLDNQDYNLLSTGDLNFKLANETLTDSQIEKINKILKARK
ncbi:MAG: hypothetical protein ACRC42_04425 [Mycoplasma sp.]